MTTWPRRYSRVRGFTLIELMVAAAVAGIVLTVMFTMFRTSNRSYVVQDYVAEMQQNLRMAMYHVSRDARMAGCGMNLMTSITSIQLFDGTAWRNVRSISAVNNPGVGPDSIEIFYGDINSGEYNAVITKGMPDASAELVVDSVSDFKVNDTVIISDGVTAALFVVSTVQPVALKLQHNPAQSPFNPPAAFKAFPNGGGYGVGSRLYNFGASRWITYSIIQTTDPTDPTFPLVVGQPVHPTLVADLHDGKPPQVVADNIEDMQCFYFMDGTVPDTHDPSANPEKIRAVRITLVARTDKQDPESVVFAPLQIEDNNPPAAPKDGYRRRVLSSIIQVRNMGV